MHSFLKQASDTAKLQSDMAKAGKFLVTSAELWGANGEIPKYTEVLAKAAKLYEECAEKTEAIRLYNKSIDIQLKPSMTNEQIGKLHPTIVETLRSLFLLLVREKKYQEAVVLADRMV